MGNIKIDTLVLECMGAVYEAFKDDFPELVKQILVGEYLVYNVRLPEGMAYVMDFTQDMEFDVRVYKFKAFENYNKLVKYGMFDSNVGGRC